MPRPFTPSTKNNTAVTVKVESVGKSSLFVDKKRASVKLKVVSNLGQRDDDLAVYFDVTDAGAAPIPSNARFA